MAPPVTTGGGSWTDKVITETFDGFLFDLDGTLIDSTEAIVKHWHTLGAELGVDPNVILATSHGRRSIDTLAEYDISKANWEYVSKIESQIPLLYGHSATLIPGALSTLQSLTLLRAPWGIVTSGSNALITGWLSIFSLPPPNATVVAEDVSAGKPDPSCYLLGRERIGLSSSTAEEDPSGFLSANQETSSALKLEERIQMGREDGEGYTSSTAMIGAEAASQVMNDSTMFGSLPTTELRNQEKKAEKKVLVIEDAPAGVRAAKAAGCTVLGLATTHEIGSLVEAGADWIVKDLEGVSVRNAAEGGKFDVEIMGVWSGDGPS